jgi:tetratricopeptide (TPR) repeat protein
MSRKSILVLILVLLIGILSFGQEMIARVKGTVKDEEGNPIPGAKITFIYLQQNLRAEAKSNKDGEYVRAGLRPGVYKVIVEAERYAIWERDGIQIMAGETEMGGVPKLDFILETKEKAKKREQAIQYQKDLVVIKKEYEEANKAFAAKDFDTAIEKYKSILELDPNQYVVTYNLGMSYINKKMFNEATSVLKKGLDIQPENAEANFYLTYSLMMAEQEKTKEVEEEMEETKGEEAKAIEDAEKYFLKALELGFNDPNALFSIGAVLVNNKKEASALKAFSKAVEINPGFERAFIEMATSHVKLGDYEKAKELFEQYLKEHPEGEYVSRADQMVKALEKILKRNE